MKMTIKPPVNCSDLRGKYPSESILAVSLLLLRFELGVGGHSFIVDNNGHFVYHSVLYRRGLLGGDDHLSDIEVPAEGEGKRVTEAGMEVRRIVSPEDFSGFAHPDFGGLVLFEGDLSAYTT